MHAVPTDMQFRVMLCQALFGNPEALLLDEPTNHLDLESIGWLEDFLHDYKGTLIVVSHDSHFLNAVTTHIADIDYETLIIYPGNYDHDARRQNIRREKEHRSMRTNPKRKKSPNFENSSPRFGAGTRASQVQSRIREIERLAAARTKKIQYPAPLHPLLSP